MEEKRQDTYKIVVLGEGKTLKFISRVDNKLYYLIVI